MIIWEERFQFGIEICSVGISMSDAEKKIDGPTYGRMSYLTSINYKTFPTTDILKSQSDPGNTSNKMIPSQGSLSSVNSSS